MESCLVAPRDQDQHAWMMTEDACEAPKMSHASMWPLKEMKDKLNFVYLPEKLKIDGGKVCANPNCNICKSLRIWENYFCVGDL